MATEAEKVIVGGLLSALALMVPMFLFHVAPQFPGSFIGFLFGVAAATLFVLLLAYSLVKRYPWIRERFKRVISIGTVLSFHVYAGTLGALLGIIHSGHKFQSPLGITLIILMLTVVATGFVGRYYLAQIGLELSDKQKELTILRNRYDSLVHSARNLENQAVVDPSGIAFTHLLGAISDLEFSITAQDLLKKAFGRWLIVHIVTAIAMYAALALHIWSSIYYGLRWLS
ncbi:Ferric reductase like transmembrane component [Legionella cherrii]|uniref:Ferric reductase like transmembrane component n=1 Tax=Legionella cherrii TaxID=28084 RepID=A0A0W0S9T4_9GAMM|nr:iron reductase [Legionella cherrii]KTC80167.1 Ferric reductase like transmembrane component [Legionella cherrii]